MAKGAEAFELATVICEICEYSLQISLGSISSFMRVYNSTVGMMKSENIAGIPF